MEMRDLFFLFGSKGVFSKIYWLVPLYYWGLVLEREREKRGLLEVLFGYSGILFHLSIWSVGALSLGWELSPLVVFWGVMSLLFGYVGASLPHFELGLRRGFFFWAGSFSLVWLLSLDYPIDSNFSALLAAGLLSVGAGLLLVGGAITSVLWKSWGIGVDSSDLGEFPPVLPLLERGRVRVSVFALAVLSLALWSFSVGKGVKGFDFWVVVPLFGLALIQLSVHLLFPRNGGVIGDRAGFFFSIFSGIYAIFWSILFTIGLL